MHAFAWHHACTAPHCSAAPGESVVPRFPALALVVPVSLFSFTAACTAADASRESGPSAAESGDGLRQRTREARCRRIAVRRRDDQESALPERPDHAASAPHAHELDPLQRSAARRGVRHRHGLAGLARAGGAGHVHAGRQVLHRADLREREAGRFVGVLQRVPGTVGLVVEKVSGVPFAKFTKDNVFVPLGMSSTTCLLSDTDKTRLATPYSTNPQNGQQRAEQSLGLPDWHARVGPRRRSARHLHRVHVHSVDGERRRA